MAFWSVWAETASDAIRDRGVLAHERNWSWLWLPNGDLAVLAAVLCRVERGRRSGVAGSGLAQGL